jgi:hypothetical protein
MVDSLIFFGKRQMLFAAVAKNAKKQVFGCCFLRWQQAVGY